MISILLDEWLWQLDWNLWQPPTDNADNPLQGAAFEYCIIHCLCVSSVQITITGPSESQHGDQLLLTFELLQDPLVFLSLLLTGSLVQKALVPSLKKLKLTQMLNTRAHLAIWCHLKMRLPPHPRLILNEITEYLLLPRRVEFSRTSRQ